MSIRNRNLEILEMLKTGVAIVKVAKKFNLSTSTIRFIEEEYEAENELSQKRKGIREAFRRADDLDKKWPISEIIDSLELSAIFRRRLAAHFKEIGKTEMSLQELMELIAKNESGQIDSPLLRIYGMGKIGYYQIKDQLLDVDFGRRFNEEWQKRWIQMTRKGY